MDRRAWIAVLSLSSLGGCNWVDGACWLKSDESSGSGAGGAPIVSNGGAFGDAPDPKPQSANDPPPPPECLQVPQGPCYEKCLSDYTDTSAKCGKIEIESQRLVCQESAYQAYKVCRDACEKAEDGCKKCKLQCDQEHDACHAKCKTSSCHAACNEAYGKCLKECGDCPH